MVNTKKVVPIQKIDRISAIGETMKLAGTSFTTLSSVDGNGGFEVTGTGDAGNILAAAPVKTLNFKTGVTAGVVYFIAGTNFGGFKVAGTAVTPTGTVVADGITLMTATLATGSVTVAQITP